LIALIVNNECFPSSYEKVDGNRADVSTMETILRMVERTYSKARRIWVVDRGIVSEKNLAAIRKREGQYPAGMPRSQMKRVQRLPVVGGARCSLRRFLGGRHRRFSEANSRLSLPSCSRAYPLSPTNIPEPSRDRRNKRSGNRVMNQLHGWLTQLGCSLGDLQRTALVSEEGHDTYSRRIVRRRALARSSTSADAIRQSGIDRSQAGYTE
jgi:hypothetical protein